MVSYAKSTKDSRHVTGGSVEPDRNRPAFSFAAPHSMPLPVIIAVPHAGRAYPASVLEQMRDQELCTLRLEDRLVDLLGVAIAKQTGTGLLVANAPRAMLDLNRDRDDVDWDMIAGYERVGIRHSHANRRARSGLGLVPRRLPGFGEIWNRKLERTELDARIDSIHRPYHEFLRKELDRVRDQWGAALLIDLHSMPPLRVKAGQDRAPTFVLGDRFGASCHGGLVTRAFSFLESQGARVSHNRPYSGGYVLDRHSSPARGIHAFQLEVCRSIYLKRGFAEPSHELDALGKLLASMVRELGAETARLGDGGQLAFAAE